MNRENRSYDIERIGNAEGLYRALGSIDDCFVAEAIGYRREQRKKARTLPRPRVIATAVAALLVLTVAVGLFSRHLLPDAGGDPPPSGDASVLWSATAGFDENAALLTCLSESRTQVLGQTEKPTLRGGEISIIWRDEESGTYYSVTLDGLSTGKRERLEQLLEDPAASLVMQGESPAPFSLWITSGDGTAVSPYLAASSGNVSYGVPSDYVPEQLPSEALAEFLTDLIEDSLS